EQRRTRSNPGALTVITERIDARIQATIRTLKAGNGLRETRIRYARRSRKLDLLDYEDVMFGGEGGTRSGESLRSDRVTSARPAAADASERGPHAYIDRP